jgi:hypothetical protein
MQKRKAEHIEEGYASRGVPAREASRRAFTTVSKESGGGKKSGPARGRAKDHASPRQGGRKRQTGRWAAARSGPARKAARTRTSRGRRAA